MPVAPTTGGSFCSGTDSGHARPSRDRGRKSSDHGFSVFLRSVGSDLQPSHHEVHEMAPVFKIQIGRQRADVIEKRAPRSDLGPQQPIGSVGELQERMQTEGQQVHCGQERGEVPLAVAEVVLQVVALGLEHVVAFILDLPPRASGGHQARDVAGVDLPVGDESVAVKHLCLRVGDRQLAPVDP